MEDTLIREIITIDEEKCNGCGACVPNCPEGALQIIDGKARLVGDLLCDGLGACVGRCPEGAMTVEKRAADPYDEAKVMANVVPQGVNTVIAHINHLKHSGAREYLAAALDYIAAHEFAGKAEVVAGLSAPAGHDAGHQGCPGSRAMSFGKPAAPAQEAPAIAGSPSALTHWPVQMHLINPDSPHFQGSDLLLAADCTAYAFGGFHGELLAGKTLTIACPKLDSGAEIYVQKLTALIDRAKVNTITVAIMEVPCCGGLLQIVQAAVAQATRKVPVKRILVGISGEIQDETWV